jgi:hypothetical protein
MRGPFANVAIHGFVDFFHLWIYAGPILFADQITNLQQICKNLILFFTKKAQNAPIQIITF